MATAYMKAIFIVIIFALGAAFVAVLEPQSAVAQYSDNVHGCSQAPGFICYSLSYSAQDGNVIAQVAQYTPSNWTNTRISFLPLGTQYVEEIPQTSWNDSFVINGTMVHGIPYNLTLPATSPVPKGSVIYGQIWARFQISDGGTVYYTRLATVNATAS